MESLRQSSANHRTLRAEPQQKLRAGSGAGSAPRALLLLLLLRTAPRTPPKEHPSRARGAFWGVQ
eukprot:7507167-Alexandrium_andersonii.AAC.1